MTRIKRNLVSVVLLMAVIQMTGCKSQEIACPKRIGDIAIDGDYSDWQGNLTFIEKKNVSVGFVHDDEFFYVCFVTNDSQFGREIMGRGLILWLDSEPDKTGKIGIKYPLGMMSKGMFPGNMSQGGVSQGAMSPGGQGGGEGGRGQTKQGSPSQVALNEVEIQLPEEEELERYTFSELTGTRLEVRSAMKDEKLVYEMKIPLHYDETHSYALGEGDILSVKLEIETPEMEGMGSGGSPRGGGEGGGMGGSGMGGGMPPGGGPGGGGRMPPGSGPSGNSSNGASQSEEFKASFHVLFEE